jgi:hypothetical protein
MMLVGIEPRLSLVLGDYVLTTRDAWEFASDIPAPQSIDQDPWTFVVSINIHRRHLPAEKKRELIAKLLKATPEKSDRQIAEQTKSNRTTVGQIRKELEDKGTCQSVDTRTDTKGRKQPARKSATKDAAVKAAVERAVARSEENRRRQTSAGNDSDPQESAEQRKAEAAPNTPDEASPDALQEAIDDALGPLLAKIKRLEHERDKRHDEAPKRKDEFGNGQAQSPMRCASSRPC